MISRISKGLTASCRRHPVRALCSEPAEKLLGVPWGRLGEPVWAALGCIGGHWGRLGLPWGHLGTSWAALVPPGCLLGGQKAPKTYIYICVFVAPPQDFEHSGRGRGLAASWALGGGTRRGDQDLWTVPVGQWTEDSNYASQPGAP